MTDPSKPHSEEIKKYSDLLLGNSLDLIMQASDSMVPTIHESVFKRDVLPLIQKPFYLSSMNAYVKIVGELTNELKVVDDNSKVLFIVPAFIQTTGVSIPKPGTPAASTYLNDIREEGERGVDTNSMIGKLLSNITPIRNLEETVLNPLRQILQRYGLEIDLSDENNSIEYKSSVDRKNVADSSFTEEYE